MQLSAYSARGLRLLNLSSLTSALRNDPDLGRLNNSDLPKIVQSLYACTGCDYTLRLVLLAGTNFSILVVCCIWQVFILAFLR